MIIELSKEEVSFCNNLAKGRFDRARKRGSELSQIGSKFSRYQDDIHGMLSEWAVCKLTNTFPTQVISPVIKFKKKGEDLGDIEWKGLRFDVKSTHHKTGELWTDVVNKNIDAYIFVVVSCDGEEATCDIKGVMTADDLHNKPTTHGSKKQFRKPAHCATIEELIPWDVWKERTVKVSNPKDKHGYYK